MIRRQCSYRYCSAAWSRDIWGRITALVHWGWIMRGALEGHL